MLMAFLRQQDFSQNLVQNLMQDLEESDQQRDIAV